MRPRGGAIYLVSPDLGPPSGLRLAEEEIEEIVMDLAKDGPQRTRWFAGG